MFRKRWLFLLIRRKNVVGVLVGIDLFIINNINMVKLVYMFFGYLDRKNIYNEGAFFFFSV